MRVSRGGHTLKTGDIGKVNCLRQQIMMPGERMNMSIEGRIRLESLRERDSMRINAHLATFMTPLRWLVPEWPDYIKEGPQTDIVIPEMNFFDFDKIGIGARGKSETPGDTCYRFWPEAYLRVYNEWYKWPEDDDLPLRILNIEGNACPLQKTWSRLRYDSAGDPVERTIESGESFDVRTLAQVQGRFRSSMKRDVLSFNRWMELVNETWKGDASREVDQVPIMLDQVEVGVNPREIPATDGASLGQWQSLFDFNVDHQINGIIAPEHCIITTMLVIRFAATVEGAHPLRGPQQNWFFTIGDPEYMASVQPQQVTEGQLFPVNTNNVNLGYAPAGWQWRSDHDVIGSAIDVRDSFPYSLVPNNQAETKDATRVKDAFRSQSLDDYLVDVFIKEDCVQPVGDAMDSYFSGMADHTVVKTGGRGQEFPKGGKNL